jgi:hypothetical protein
MAPKFAVGRHYQRAVTRLQLSVAHRVVEACGTGYDAAPLGAPLCSEPIFVFRTWHLILLTPMTVRVLLTF